MVELCLTHCDSIPFYPMVWVWLLKYKSEIMLIFCTLKRLCIDTCFCWCLKEFYKAFSSFSNTEKEFLHRLFLQVCTLDVNSSIIRSIFLNVTSPEWVDPGRNFSYPVFQMNCVLNLGPWLNFKDFLYTYVSVNLSRFIEAIDYQKEVKLKSHLYT